MSSVLFLLATVLVAADAMVVWRKFSGSGLQDKAFTQNVLFTSPAKSAVQCGVLCNQHKPCDKFTFEQDLCRGHALGVTPATSYKSAAGARSFSVSKLAPGRPMAMDCVEAQHHSNQSGVVTIFPDDNTPLQVYCDQVTDGGGWLVFQRRQDGSVDFYRNWTEYQDGFGDLNGEFWLGLDNLHMLTSSQSFELRVDLMKWDNTTGYATYSNFSISDSSDNYRLNFDSFTGGNAGDSLHYHRDTQFSTWDRDHDTHSDINCAQIYHAAWWYKGCTNVNLNGEYFPNGNVPSGRHGVFWNDFGGGSYSHKFSAMKIRVA